ncbi:MAG: hypothetical protein H6621_02265 [Halobacteriovoraceae bacterium]|nr:hypothetical protein [Halobacteriovoraceae bacterium]MCB9093868.1 hypothetical protein [Halobacteriovoraceae bacterium]
MKKLVFLVSVLFSMSIFADSWYIDSARLDHCGGRVELRQSRQNFHLQFEGVQNCSNVEIQTHYKGYLLNSYKLTSADSVRPYNVNYTLSNRVWNELYRDGEINIYIHSNSKKTWDNVKLIYRY